MDVDGFMHVWICMHERARLTYFMCTKSMQADVRFAEPCLYL